MGMVSFEDICTCHYSIFAAQFVDGVWTRTSSQPVFDRLLSGICCSGMQWGFWGLLKNSLQNFLFEDRRTRKGCAQLLS